MEVSLTLRIAIAAYCGATLLHFAHNAAYLADYPNMPASITALNVWQAWLAITAVGVLGGLLLWRGFPRTGLAVLAVYAALGFDGLLHYDLAPVASHTAGMNFTIGFEVAMATVLLAVLAWQWRKT